MIKLIVHADDFGISEKVNLGILEAYTKGILTSTSLMANGKAFEHAVEICKTFPGMDIGVHLTLVEENPVSAINEVSSLINEDGRFYKKFIEFSKSYFIGRINFQELQKELDAQIMRVRESGVNISHLDSHQHIHMLPKILKITIDLAIKYNIPFIRFPREIPVLGMFLNRDQLIRVFEMLVLNSFCMFGKFNNTLRTDHFAGFFFSGNLNKQNLMNLIRNLPLTGTCELMCHPGFDDPKTQYKHWGYNWSEELKALTDPEVIKLIQDSRIRLISYRQLKTA